MEYCLDHVKDFFNANPVLFPFSILGASVCFSKFIDFFNDAIQHLKLESLEDFRKKFKGDWAFIADTTKSFGKEYALLLGKLGYDILTFKTPGMNHTNIEEKLKLMGRNLECVNVESFCTQYQLKSFLQLKASLKDKIIGIVIMNLFFEMPCRFEYELPIVLNYGINSGIVHTAIYLQAIIDHLNAQPNKSAVIGVGSILSCGKWPYHQITCGTAAFIDKFIEEQIKLNGSKIKFLSLKRGYIPYIIKNSFYNADPQKEIENSLRMIGVFTKGMSHLRVILQHMYHSCSLGKNNRIAYSKAALFKS